MKNLINPLIFFDLETTGIDVSSDRIVELSARKLMPDGTFIVKTRRFNPGMPIPAAASAVHGIYDADVAALPSFAEYAPSIADFFRGCDIAGFNILRFDLPLLVEEFYRASVSPPFSSNTKTIDAKIIYHHYERRDLSTALKFYCDLDHEGAHAAEADVEATAKVLDAQITKYDLPSDVNSLHELSTGGQKMVDYDGKFFKNEDGIICFAFGKNKGKRAISDPRYLEWMLTGSFTLDTKYWCKHLLNLAAEPLAY